MVTKLPETETCDNDKTLQNAVLEILAGGRCTQVALKYGIERTNLAKYMKGVAVARAIFKNEKCGLKISDTVGCLNSIKVDNRSKIGLFIHNYWIYCIAVASGLCMALILAFILR